MAEYQGGYVPFPDMAQPEVGMQSEDAPRPDSWPFSQSQGLKSTTFVEVETDQANDRSSFGAIRKVKSDTSGGTR